MGNISSSVFISSDIINPGRADAVGASGLFAVTLVTIFGNPVDRQELKSSYPCTDIITCVNCCAIAFINALSIFQKEIKKMNPELDSVTFYTDCQEIVTCLNDWTTTLPDYGKADCLEEINPKDRELVSNMFDRYTQVKLLCGDKLSIVYVDSAVEPTPEWTPAHALWRDINIAKDLASDNIDRQLIEAN